MAYVARIRDLQALGLGGGDETERMAANIYVRDSLLDARHVAGYTLAAARAGFVMSMLFESGGVRADRGAWPVTLETEEAGRFQQIGIIVGPVNVVAAKAFYSAGVHQAGDEIVALHAVLMGRAIGEVSKGRLARLMLLQSPVVP